MNTPRLIILLFFIFQLSKGINITGYVKNFDTGEPVPFASISIYSEQIGVSSDTCGFYKLKIPEIFSSKFILYFSSIGYYDTLIVIENVTELKIEMFLKPRQYVINEVEIKPNYKNQIVIDKIKKSFINQAYYSGAVSPRIIGKYFRYKPEYEGYIIKEISVLFDRWYDYNINPTFFIRFFTIDTIKNIPGEGLNENILIKMEQSRQTNNFVLNKDIEGLNIKIPKCGIIIGIEWIGIKENWVENKKDKYEFYSPELKGIFGKNIDGKEKWEYYGGIWKNGEESESKSTPSIGLKLTN